MRLRRRAEVVPVELTGEWRGADRIHRTIMLFEAARNMAGLQDRERARLSPKLNAALDEGRAIAAAGYEAALRGRERAIGEPPPGSTPPATRAAARCGRCWDSRR